MVTLATLRTDIKDQFYDKTGRFITDAKIDLWVNQAQRDIAVRTDIFEREKSFAITAGSALLTPPTDMIRPRLMLYQNRIRILYRPFAQMAGIGAYREDIRGIPRFYMLWEKKIRLYPVPSTSSSSSTLSANIGATDTSLTLADASAFRTAGRIIIDSEEIGYNGKSGNTLENLVRGLGGTAAASHALGATVTEADLRLFYIRRPVDASATVDPELPDEYAPALVTYALMKAYRADGRFREAQLADAEYERWVQRIHDDVAKLRANDTNQAIMDESYEDYWKWGLGSDALP